MKELVEIQSKLKAPKSQYNSFGKYKYRNCEDILEALKPLMKEQGCHLVITDDVVMIGSRIYIKATVTLTNAQGETVTNSALAREEETKKGMDGSQVTGASSSYARKYALNGMFCIDDTKDSDTTNTHGNDEKPAAKQVVPPFVDDDTLQIVLGEIRAAQSLATLGEIYNRCTELHSTPSFMAALSTRKEELKK